MKIILPLILALALLLCGCGGSDGETAKTADVRVYCPVSADYQDELGLIAPKTVTVADTGEGAETALTAFKAAPADEKLLSPLSSGVRIVSSELVDGEMTVELSETLMSLTGMERTVLCACLAETVCAVPEVSSVTVICGGEIVVSHMTAGDLLTDNTLISPTNVGVRLYFPKAEDGAMGFEYRTITLAEGDYADRSIIDELLKGPNDPSLVSTIPAETVLLSVFTENSVCTVSLSLAFLGNDSTTGEAARGAVYSIVDSLTSIKGISSVQILIDGRETASVCGVDISKPLTSGSADNTLAQIN